MVLELDKPGFRPWLDYLSHSLVALNKLHGHSGSHIPYLSIGDI